MSEIDRYLSRMTPENVWPAGHDPAEVAATIASTVDPESLVLRWNTNNQCPMDDMLAAWITLGVITREQADATSAMRAIETRAFLASYRASDHTPSDEELFEMEAAFGPGTKVVNVITGRMVQL